MGGGVAANLIRGGHDVVVWDRSPEAVQTVARQGASPASSPSNAVVGVGALFTMLPDDLAVEEAVLHSGALDAAPRGCVHVNLATVSAALAERMEKLHCEAGLGYVAAPVLGPPEAAAEGALNVILAGDPAAVAQMRPLIALFAKTVWPFGDNAARANVVKLACNLALASMIETLGETAVLADGYGVPPADLFALMTSTLFGCPVYETYSKVIAEGRFSPPAFRLRLGAKDLRLALHAGEAADIPLPLASLLRDRLIESIAHGDGDKDGAALAAGAFRRAGRAIPGTTGE